MHTFFNFYSILKMELKQFHREKIVWASLILVSVYFMIGYRYFFKESIRVGQFFQSSGYIGVASILLGIVLGALSASREKRYHFSDTISSLTKNILIVIAKMTAWLWVSSAMIIFIFIELLFLIWFHDSEFLFFGDMILLYITLYWGIPLFSAGLIGYAAETAFPSRWWKMPFLFFILFITSPFNYVLAPFVPSPLLAFLNQGERDLEAAYHGIQGLEIGCTVVIKRVIFFLASVVLISLSVFFAHELRKTKREKSWIMGFTIALIFIVTWLIPRAFSPLDLAPHHFASNYFAYYNRQDFNYYTQLNNATPNADTHNQPADFNVSTYQIRLKHQKNEIQYSVDLFIEDVNPENQWLIFTLYHGLMVKGINQGEIPLDWERKGDLLFVKWPLASSDGILSMQIAGNGGVFNQISETSLFLSSSFPWYPIPGRHVVAEFSTLSSLQFKNIGLPGATYFTVTLKGKAKTYSNLPREEGNVFSGAAVGATLISGTLLESYAEGIKVIYPPDSLDLLIALLPELRNRIDAISNWLDVPAPQMPSQVFVVPHTSYEPDSVLFYTGDQLFISELKTRYIYQIERTVAQLLNSKSLFNSFFYANTYRDGENISPMIIGLILEHFEIEKKENSTLSTYAKSSMHYENLEMPEELAQLEVFAVKILELYNQGYKKEIQYLVQKIYSELQDDVKTIEDWLKLLDTEIASDLNLNNDLSIITKRGYNG